MFSEQTAAAEEEKTQRLASDIRLRQEQRYSTRSDAVLGSSYWLAIYLCDYGSECRMLAVMEGNGVSEVGLFAALDFSFFCRKKAKVSGLQPGSPRTAPCCAL